MKELNEGPGANREGMDVDEFLTWAAFVAIEPFGEDRADAHTAMVMAQQYNMNRGKGAPVRKPVDFLPQWYRPARPRQTTEQLKRAMQLQYLALGGDPKAVG